MSRMQAERESIMVQDTLMLHGKQIQHMRRVFARRERLQTVFKLDSKSVCLSVQLRQGGMHTLYQREMRKCIVRRNEQT